MALPLTPAQKFLNGFPCCEPPACDASRRKDAIEGVNKEGLGELSLGTLLPMVWFLVQAMLQLFRGSLCFLALIVTAQTYRSDEARMWFGLGPVYYYSAPLAIWLACSLAQDSQFLRAFCGLTGREKPGVYYKKTESNMRLAALVPDFNKPFEGTWWLPTGDIATFFPFIAYKDFDVKYIRKWLPTGSGEKVAVDFCFPAEGFDTSKPIVLILHGLNGGSGEPYVKYMAKHAMERGHTVCVMVARGLMATPIDKGSFFHGARVSDVSKVVKALHLAAGEDASVYGIGFSMGAVVLTNYIAKSGPECGLAGGIAVSGCLDVVYNSTYKHSIQYWQEALAYELKKNFLYPFWNFAKMKDIDTTAAAKAKTVVDFDSAYMAPYHGYSSALDYYKDMSAAYPAERLQDIKVPLLNLHACDDPIIDVDNFPVQQTINNTNIFYLLTKTGGHVGWPEGSWPCSKPWEFMCRLPLDFIQASHSCKTASETSVIE